MDNDTSPTTPLGDSTSGTGNGSGSSAGPTPHAAPHAAPHGGTAADSGFFPWLRGLGVTREPGWLGGVAAGVAARLGIDALIVRGIIVVIAILGGPALLLYAAAWLLLPDASGRIHLQELFRGVWDRALAGIAIMVLLALLPFGGGWWWFDGWDGPWSNGGLGPTIAAITWTVLLTGAAIWFVVWIASRPSSQAPTAPPYGSTPSAAPSQSTMPDASAATSAATLPLVPESGTTFAAAAPSAPPAAPAAAGDAELVAWREGQAEWKREHDAWRAQQAASERAAHQLRLEEDRRRRQAETAERARVAREKELLTRPNSAFTLVAIGLALVAGAATALLLDDPDLTVTARTAASLSVTLAVLGLAIVINGLRGRRSGGSSAVAILVVVSLAFTGGLGWFRVPLITDGSSPWQPVAGESDTVRVVVADDVMVDLEDYFDGSGARDGDIDLFVISGDVEVIMPAEANSRVEVQSIAGDITVDGRRSDSGTFSSATARYESDTQRRVSVDIFVVAGDVSVAQAD